MKCPVCENDTFDEKDYEYAICSECFWEYDLIQIKNPNFAGGANHSSLNEYRKIYQRLKTEDPGHSFSNGSFKLKLPFLFCIRHPGSGGAHLQNLKKEHNRIGYRPIICR